MAGALAVLKNAFQILQIAVQRKTDFVLPGRQLKSSPDHEFWQKRNLRRQ